MLPVGIYYAFINKFVQDFSRFERGLVAHALAASVRALLKEYYLLVVQLETEFRGGGGGGETGLTLQKLYYHVTPTLRTLESIAALATEIHHAGKGCKGGVLLNIITAKGSEASGYLFALLSIGQTQKVCLNQKKFTQGPKLDGALRASARPRDAAVLCDAADVAAHGHDQRPVRRVHGRRAAQQDGCKGGARRGLQ
jgi:gamma-tubulin complex component 2